MASSQITGVALVYISSALFDSKHWGLSNFEKAKIVNLINMAICAVGTILCLFIKCM